jgi:predicted MFS family arabinose efflux permease
MSPSAKTAPRAVEYGSAPLVALAATVMLEAGERGSLSQAVDGVNGIQAHFHVSDFWIGALPTAMTLIGILGSMPFGHLADRVRRTVLLAGAMAVWTLVMGLNAIAPTFLFLFLTRIGVGTVEANGPASISLLSDYYPVHERAHRIGLYNSGALLGSALGLGLAGVLVDAWGWRAAFWMWIPFGLVTVTLLLRAPEPQRGDQDIDFHAATESALGAVDAAELAATLHLPPPTRTSTINYDDCGWRDAYREIFRIRSMWFAVIGITVGQFLLAGLAFWGVPYFKEVHHLSASAAGGYVIVFGLGAAIGVVSGGYVADRLLRRGIVNARIYVVVVSSLIATIAFIPAFATSSLALTLPLFLIGGVFLTLPVAPADALLTDVVVAPLRGRAAGLRSVVRSVAGIAPLVIGALKGMTDLQTALVIVTPVYAVGGLIVLIAARTYPSDLAFVIAESRRLRVPSGHMVTRNAARPASVAIATGDCDK